MTSRDDLDWWLDRQQDLDWIFATTYAKTAPHEYIVAGRTDGMTPADFVRAARVIHTYGGPAKFWNSTNIYLNHQGMKYWTMDANLAETDLINRAPTSDVYGVQDAPATHSGIDAPFDGIATVYDAIRDTSADREVCQQIVDHFGDHAPTTLDVGCGTGALLDTGLIPPSQYTGVDPSQAMLNALVRKHPRVGRLIPSRFEDANELEDSYELVVAMDVPGLDRSQLEGLCSGLLVVT